MPMRIINVKFQDEEIEMVESLKAHIKKLSGVEVNDEQAIKLILAMCADDFKSISNTSLSSGV